MGERGPLALLALCEAEDCLLDRLPARLEAADELREPRCSGAEDEAGALEAARAVEEVFAVFAAFVVPVPPAAKAEGAPLGGRDAFAPAVAELGCGDEIACSSS